MQKFNLMPMRFETWKIHRWIKTTANWNNLKLRFWYQLSFHRRPRRSRGRREGRRRCRSRPGSRRTLGPALPLLPIKYERKLYKTKSLFCQKQLSSYHLPMNLTLFISGIPDFLWSSWFPSCIQLARNCHHHQWSTTITTTVIKYPVFMFSPTSTTTTVTISTNTPPLWSWFYNLCQKGWPCVFLCVYFLFLLASYSKLEKGLRRGSIKKR